MHPGVATNVCAASACLLLLAACTSAPPPPARLDQAQIAKCKALERAYRDGAPEYVALRDELAKDPVAAAWVTRMFVHDLIAMREERPLGEDQELMAAAANLELKAETRAYEEIKTLGAVAVPTLIDDLLRNPQAHPRELGIELLGRIGQPARAPVLQLARNGDLHERRAAARALGAIGIDAEVFALLRELATSGDYTQRADALRALRGGDDAAQRFVRERMEKDDDAFVRRTAAQTLGYSPKTANALAIVDFIERCRRDRDREGERIAQRALMRMSGTYKARQPADWRAWAPELDARPAVAPATSGTGR